MKTAARTKIDELTDSFADNIPQKLRDKILSIALLVKNDFISDLGGWPEPFGKGRMEKISGKSYDGFWAWQDGGFEVSALYRQDCDTSYHITQSQSGWIEESTKYMYECFRSDHEELNLPEDYSYHSLSEDLQNEFLDYENEWYEPALLRFELWVDPDNGARYSPRRNTGKVFFRLSLGYRDAPYYRSKNDETLFQFELTPKQVMEKPAEFFLKLIQRKYKGVK